MQVTLYRNRDFVDLCRGPHLPSTGKLAAFKLLRTAGAYWRGDEHRPQLQRIYGTAWESRAALDDYLHRLEEARRRDHRRLGAELDLFSFPTELGSGLAIWHPKGATIRALMEDYSRRTHEAHDYQLVASPHVARAELWEQSGHLGFYAENMYPLMELDDGDRYVLKPMNCPFHILIFQSRGRSYRELPLRLFELGTVYRYERSGVLHGLLRARGFTQDDSHIFCMESQIGRGAAAPARLLAHGAARLRLRGISKPISPPGPRSRWAGRICGSGRRRPWATRSTRRAWLTEWPRGRGPSTAPRSTCMSATPSGGGGR